MTSAFHPVLTLLAVLLNSIFVMSEYVLIRIIKPKIENMEEPEDFGNRYLNRISEKLNPHIFSAQIGITLTTIVFGYLVMDGFSKFSTDTLNKFNIFSPFLGVISILIAISLAVFFYTLFADYIPKLYAAGNINQVAKWIAPVIYYFNFTTLPFRFVIIRFVGMVFRILKFEVAPSIYLPVYDEEELRYFLERSTSGGKIEPSEQQMINRIFQFNDITVKEILTPRVRVVSLNVNDDLQTIKDLVINSRFSKFPMYEDNIENIIGIIHVKDILALGDDNSIDMRLLKKKFMPIHDGMRLDVLLKKMKNKHVYISVVYDEYGTFTGIVTLEDILSALIGPITVLDDDNFHVHEVSSNTFRIHPFMSILEFNRLFGVNIISDNAVSLSGFIIAHNDGIPAEDTQFILDDIKFFNFKVLGNRILDFSIRIKDHHRTEELTELLS